MNLEELRSRLKKSAGGTKSDGAAFNPTEHIKAGQSITCRFLPYEDSMTGLFFFPQYTFSPTVTLTTGEIVTIPNIPTERSFYGTPPWECQVSREVNEIWMMIRNGDFDEHTKKELREKTKMLGSRRSFFYFGFIEDISGAGDKDSFDPNVVVPIRIYPTIHKIIENVLQDDSDITGLDHNPFGEFSIPDVEELVASGGEPDNSFSQYLFIIRKTAKGDFASYETSNFANRKRIPMSMEQIRAAAEYDFEDAKQKILGPEPQKEKWEIYSDLMKSVVQSIIDDEPLQWKQEWTQIGIGKFSKGKTKPVETGAHRTTEEPAITRHDPAHTVDLLKENIMSRRTTNSTLPGDDDDDIPF